MRRRLQAEAEIRNRPIVVGEDTARVWRPDPCMQHRQSRFIFSRSGKVPMGKHGFVFHRAEMIMPCVLRRQVWRRLTCQQGQGISDAEQFCLTCNGNVGEELRMFCVDFAIEEELDSDPVLAHAGKIGSDTAITVDDGSLLVLILFRPMSSTLDERGSRFLRGREPAPSKEYGSSKQDPFHDISPPSSVCPFAASSFCSSS